MARILSAYGWGTLCPWLGHCLSTVRVLCILDCSIVCLWQGGRLSMSTDCLSMVRVLSVYGWCIVLSVHDYSTIYGYSTTALARGIVSPPWGYCLSITMALYLWLGYCLSMVTVLSVYDYGAVFLCHSIFSLCLEFCLSIVRVVSVYCYDYGTVNLWLGYCLCMARVLSVHGYGIVCLWLFHDWNIVCLWLW